MDTTRIMICSAGTRDAARVALEAVTGTNQSEAFLPELSANGHSPVTHHLASQPFTEAQMTALEAYEAATLQGIDENAPFVLSILDPEETPPQMRARFGLKPVDDEES